MTSIIKIIMQFSELEELGYKGFAIGFHGAKKASLLELHQYCKHLLHTCWSTYMQSLLLVYYCKVCDLWHFMQPLLHHFHNQGVRIPLQGVQKRQKMSTLSQVNYIAYTYRSNLFKNFHLAESRSTKATEQVISTTSKQIIPAWYNYDSTCHKFYGLT